MRQHIILFYLLSALIISNDSIGQTRFAAPVDISNGSVSGVTSLDAADFNGDGLLDVVVMEGGKHSAKRTFAWFEQKNAHHWRRHELGTAHQLDSFLGSARCDDMDSDGDPDIVFTSDNHTLGPVKVIVAENPGGIKIFEPWKLNVIATFEGAHANDMQIADMNNDRRKDIIIRHKSPNTIRILFQQSGNEWRVRSIRTEQLGNEGFAVGNLDGDTTMDISANGCWFKAPANPMNEEYELFCFDTTFARINPNTKEDIGDINGDKRNDVIISPAEGYYNGNNHVLAWYEASGNPETPSNWTQHIIRSNYNWAHSVKLVDIDNDGDIDVISGKAWSPSCITIFFNNKCDFSKELVVIEGRGIYSGAIKDVDNDGDVDIIGEDTYSNQSHPWYYENQLLSNIKKVSGVFK
jgi:hypothetical protein